MRDGAAATKRLASATIKQSLNNSVHKIVNKFETRIPKASLLKVIIKKVEIEDSSTIKMGWGQFEMRERRQFVKTLKSFLRYVQKD